MPSIALSKSASEASRQTSVSRILPLINCVRSAADFAHGRGAHVEKVVDELDLVMDGEGALGEIAQKATTLVSAD